MSELKTFRVTVPFFETVCGREFYIVEAKSESEALELVKTGDVYVHDTVTDGALDDFEPHFEEAEVEDWS